MDRKVREKERKEQCWVLGNREVKKGKGGKMVEGGKRNDWAGGKEDEKEWCREERKKV